MIQRDDHGLIVDDVKRMAQLAGIPDTCYVTKVGAVALEKVHERPCGLIRESEDNLMVDPMFGGVLRDSSKNRKSIGDGHVEGDQISALHVRQNPLPRGGERDKVPPDMTIDAQR